MLFDGYNIKRNDVKIIAESCEFDFTSVDSLDVRMKRAGRFNQSKNFFQ
jgi:hypothetical protein